MLATASTMIAPIAARRRGHRLGSWSPPWLRMSSIAHPPEHADLSRTTIRRPARRHPANYAGKHQVKHPYRHKLAIFSAARLAPRNHQIINLCESNPSDGARRIQFSGQSEDRMTGLFEFAPA
jgi:hypothetical protein